jgi:hypothetical protein
MADPIVRSFVHFLVYVGYGAVIGGLLAAAVIGVWFIRQVRKANREAEEFDRRFKERADRIESWVDEEHNRRRPGSGRIV